MNRIFAAVKLALVLALSVCARAAAPDVHAIAQTVDERYNRLHTLTASFTEIYRGAGVERTESGMLWLKKPGKMRWEYRSPKEKLFLSDGKDAWFYLPGDRQARKTAAKKLDDLRSPLRFLLGKTRLEKELQGLSFAPDITPLARGNVVLRGVPQALEERVNQVALEVNAEGEIVRLIIQEADGSATEFRLIEQKENVEVSDASFRFTPPSGVEVIEGDLGQ